jgi:hypothetical protein
MRIFELTPSELLNIRTKALRRKVWFRVLDSIDRTILNLTIKCVKKVRSLKLLNILKLIINKLKVSLESYVKRIRKTVGYSIAKKISMLANNWGNSNALSWTQDSSFIQYLTIVHMNTPEIFRNNKGIY